MESQPDSNLSSSKQKSTFATAHDDDYQGEDEGQGHSDSQKEAVKRMPTKDYKEDQHLKEEPPNSKPESDSEDTDSEQEEEEEEEEASQTDDDPYATVEESPKGRFTRSNEELGSGAYKSVYRGIDNETGREIAWNVIKINKLPKVDRKRISEEIHTLKNMKEHPNIIHFISAWINKEKEEVVFVTEMVTAGSLRQYLKKIKRPRLKVLKTWAIQILKGLQYLHELDPPIIHRDIKCDNIFINSHKGEIRIGDLGLSTSLNHSFTTSVLGTPEFMAPELYEEKYGVSVDIYAFGMCFLEMCTLSTPYKECDNPAQIYKKVIQGIKPQAFDRIDDPEVAEFILECIEYRGKRPRARDLLDSSFFKDLDSEKNNFPVKLKTKNKGKNVRSGKDDNKTVGMHTPVGHSQMNQQVQESPTQTMIPDHEETKEQTSDENRKQSSAQRTHKRKIKNEQNEKESLDLFNKIETEKNKKLNIDEENLEVQYNNVPSEEKVHKTDDPHLQNRKQVIEHNLNKSQDNIMQYKAPHPVTPNNDVATDDRANASFEKYDKSPIENPQLHEAHNRDPNYQSRHTGGHMGVAQSNMEQAQSNQASETPQNNIVLKLIGISQDASVLKIEMDFPNTNRDITFDYNLKTDTPETVCNEMEEAHLGITNSQSAKIKRDINSIVNNHIEKLRKNAAKTNGGMVKEGSTSKTEASSRTSVDSHSHPPKQPELKKGSDLELNKNLEKAQYAIHHFIGAIDKEVQTIAKHQKEIEQLVSNVDTETCSISMQFIQEVIDSYRNFQYKLSKNRQSSKSKGTLETPPANQLRQTQSFKGSTQNNNLTTGNLSKSVS